MVLYTGPFLRLSLRWTNLFVKIQKKKEVVSVDVSLQSFPGGAEVFFSCDGPLRLWWKPLYAGDTELEETEEASVLEVVEAPSSSSKGFFPQHKVVIMQWRNCLFMQM